MIGELDKPIIKQITERLHGSNALPAQVNEAVDLYFEVQESAMAQRETADREQRSATIESLRQEYGQDYKGNLNAMRAYLQTMPAGIGDKLADARAPDGTLLFNDLAVLRHFVGVAVAANPAATVTGDTRNPDAAFATEIATLRTEMADNKSAYWVGPQAEAKQKRFQQLLEIEGKMKAKAA